MSGVIHEPTAEQCNANAQIEDGMFACWYPQMGGYTSKCIVMVNPEKNGCFEAWVWHDGEFPFEDDASTDHVRHIHHCDAQQFIDFGNLVRSKQP